MLALASEIVVAYVRNNSVPISELPKLIGSVHAALAGLYNTSGAASTDAAAENVEQPTAAQIKKSITPDAIISFLDGKRYKTLKRHLSAHGLDPHSYRAKFGLPADYPMVCPSYSEARSALAKNIGLGRPGRAVA
ncbi:MucR family transcriptional regulator [Methylobacterium sp. WL30]|uniref:MucR family transcriptional regulator n=1 Tax=unclassified Methylobacterium TaxID=2615210 RepID=UPI0011CADB55|nr:MULTISPECIES: MucR family transcriptional regulator [unclassified Methylobacterium]TXN41561.1 MucR family transcriptional regulator [Methylobacterium sp. WL93]TXN52430.1 MucR family transcriptional regulator [Methylobacterium sp. WL119]TXN69765.1 MucR family transcriptional regulator [Methylobacterium sp. WL30]